MRTTLKTFILSLLAVSAIGAVAASSASAHRTWWWCHPVVGTGGYNNSLCSEPNGTKTGDWEYEKIPVGQAPELNIVKINKEFVLKVPSAGEEIACESLTLTGGTIENVMVEGKGPTGRDKGTDTFSKNCRNLDKPACKVKEPIVVKGTSVLAEKPITETEEGEGIKKIYDVFLPEAGKELTPAEITAYEAERTGKATEKQEKGHAYAKIEQSGQPTCTALAATTAEGDGVAAEIVPEGLSLTKVLKFPSPRITPVKLWNGLTIGLTLNAFGFGAEETGEAEIELAPEVGQTRGNAFDVG